MIKRLGLQLYGSMLYVRRVEEAISKEYSKQEMRCPVHLSIGQEAVPVGISACLNINDHVVSAHRSHAHYLAKGGNLSSMLSELFGKDNGCAGGRGGSMHLLDLKVNFTAAVPIVGSSIAIGTGIGFGLYQNGSNAKVVVYFGDGATEEGVFFESLDFASLLGLPVLFVCEDNFYSVYTNKSDRQNRNRNLKKICSGHDITYFASSGNDVLGVYETAKKALDSIDLFKKPALIEFDTFRWLEHCGPNWDDHLNYRKEGELDKWIKKCPVKKLRKVLLENSILNKKNEQEIEAKIASQINQAFLHARESKYPKPEDLFKNVYAL